MTWTAKGIIRKMTGKVSHEVELFIRIAVHIFCERLSICVCASHSSGFESGMWDSIVLVPGHFCSFYFPKTL